MKLTKVMLAALICLLIIPIGLAKSPPAGPPVAVAGIYENFTVGQGSGDLEGMRVVIIPAGDGHYAMVQIAQGGAEDPKPEFVPATVTGMKVEFTVGDQKFTGTVNAAGMRVQTAGSEAQVLKRKPCSSLFR
jgi:hypothetical protein